jgi:hypothetical protein
VHARTVGIEDARHLDAQPVLTPIVLYREAQRRPALSGVERGPGRWGNGPAGQVASR